MSTAVLTMPQRLDQIKAGLRALDYADAQTDQARRALQTERDALMEQLEGDQDG
jgi:hypothetical protein